ncbi:MAG TPA: hypothetical protein VK436_16615 [Methanocella sp.]|nr:hypothetical protein [Methanocella sp.]
MKARHLLNLCTVLIVSSIFLAPGTVYLGIGKGLAAELSSLLLLAGIFAAVVTVNRDIEEGHDSDSDKP